MSTVQLLPDVNLPGLAFDDSCIERYTFLLRNPGAGPVEVTVDWYPDVTRGTVINAVWGVAVAHVDAGEKIPAVGASGVPMLVVPDRTPTGTATMPVDFDPGDVALTLYRDAYNPDDTAVGDAVVTRVQVQAVALGASH